MKNLFYTLTICLFIIGCSSDNSDSENNSNDDDINETCNIPTNASVSDITHNSVIINWSFDNTSTNTEIEYGTSGFNPGTGSTTISSTGTQQINGLNSNTNYDVYLKNICLSLESEIVGPLQFTTVCNGNGGGTFTGDVVLTTQQEVNDFGSNCYSSITGRLVISEDSNSIDKITSLSTLNTITSVGDLLSIFNCSQLTTLSGLENISSFNGALSISNNPLLINIDELENISSINGWLKIRDNDSLQDIDGLSGVTDLSVWEFGIRNNQSLTSISGLSNATLHNTGEMYIVNNDSLLTLDGLEGLTDSGALGTPGTEFYSYIAITGNASLISIEGLQNLTRISYGQSSSGNLHIKDNNSLQTLNGLENFISCNNLFIGDDETQGGQTYPNPNLSDFCALQNLFNNGSVAGQVVIANNAYNPTVADIQAGNCSN